MGDADQGDGVTFHLDNCAMFETALWQRVENMAVVRVIQSFGKPCNRYSILYMSLHASQ